jgi:hypothetical protein
MQPKPTSRPRGRCPSIAVYFDPVGAGVGEVGKGSVDGMRPGGSSEGIAVGSEVGSIHGPGAEEPGFALPDPVAVGRGPGAVVVVATGSVGGGGNAGGGSVGCAAVFVCGEPGALVALVPVLFFGSRVSSSTPADLVYITAATAIPPTRAMAPTMMRIGAVEEGFAARGGARTAVGLSPDTVALTLGGAAAGGAAARGAVSGSSPEGIVRATGDPAGGPATGSPASVFSALFSGSAGGGAGVGSAAAPASTTLPSGRCGVGASSEGTGAPGLPRGTVGISTVPPAGLLGSSLIGRTIYHRRARCSGTSSLALSGTG